MIYLVLFSFYCLHTLKSLGMSEVIEMELPLSLSLSLTYHLYQQIHNFLEITRSYILGYSMEVFVNRGGLSKDKTVSHPSEGNIQVYHFTFHSSSAAVAARRRLHALPHFPQPSIWCDFTTLRRRLAVDDWRLTHAYILASPLLTASPHHTTSLVTPHLHSSLEAFVAFCSLLGVSYNTAWSVRNLPRYYDCQ
ncbi:hypothetical protein V8F20_008405 [Naviculisporaceae sp. PSN 640]